LQQTRIDKCKNLPENHPLLPPVIEAIQSLPASAEGVSDLSGTGLVILNESVSTPNSLTPTPNTTTNNQTLEQSVISNLESHCSGELPGYQPQKTSDITSDEVVTENPPQHQSNQNIEHINISDSIPPPETSVYDPEISVSEQNVSKTENIEPSASDQYESDQTTDDQTSSSNLTIVPSEPTFSDIPKPPSVFLNLPFLATVCLDIFKKAKKLIESRQNLVHEVSYEEKWERIIERVQFVFSEVQRSCLNDQAQAQKELKDWLKGVMSEVHKVKVLKTWVKTPLCIEAGSVIPSFIHPRDLNLDWITKINLKEASTKMALIQRNSLLEKENHALRKKLLEQKMMLMDYKNTSEAQLEEAKIREERLIRSYEEFKKEMKQQADAQKAQMEETQRMMQQMMQMMMQHQAKP